MSIGIISSVMAIAMGYLLYEVRGHTRTYDSEMAGGCFTGIILGVGWLALLWAIGKVIQ